MSKVSVFGLSTFQHGNKRLGCHEQIDQTIKAQARARINKQLRQTFYGGCVDQSGIEHEIDWLPESEKKVQRFRCSRSRTRRVQSHFTSNDKEVPKQLQRKTEIFTNFKQSKHSGKNSLIYMLRTVITS